MVAIMVGVLVVAAAILRDGRVLACRRAGGAYAEQWEFPGGKVEPGEDETAALVRECREELGLEVTVGFRIGADTPVGVGLLRLYAATATGEPLLRVHDQAAWCSASDIADRLWLEADLALVAEVRALL
jgi:8-oxo-dGTP diphosphatase